MREEILRGIAEEVKRVAGEGYEVQTQQVRKNNGVQLQAVIVRRPGEVVAPAVYVDGYIDMIAKEEMTMAEAGKKVFEVYEEHKEPKICKMIDGVTCKEFVLDHVEYQLVNKERNIDRVNSAPHKDLLDLAALYRVVVEANEDETASYVLGNDLFERIGVSIEELDEAAARNTESVGFVVKTMAQVMAEMMGFSEEMEDCMGEGPQMYVLTNERKQNGASILMCGRQLAALADKLDDDFYILPSSIHEVLAVPASQMNYEELKQVVKDVNDTQVSDEEILGYEVYRYDREAGEIVDAV